MKIPYNKPYLTGKEMHYIYDAVHFGKISGNGKYTIKCQTFFEQRFGFKKALLTTSCTMAIEMAAILIDVQPGDEIIVPSYTFVSTANAFILRGAKVIFVDSETDNPNMDVTKLERLISSKTKAIVPVHYAGVACDMDSIMSLAEKYNLFVIEDAAQSIGAYYKDKPLGGIGHFSAFSFHETKNIISGEGGMLVVNDPKFIARSEIIWEKGTNRSSFNRGEIDKYNWIDIGSSFLASDLTAAFLYAQLENMDDILHRRNEIWRYYINQLRSLEKKGLLLLPKTPNYANHNAHIFYILLKNVDMRNELINHLKENGILAVFHYLSLHKSPYYEGKHGEQPSLPVSEYFEECLLRLPLYYKLSREEQDFIIIHIREFFEKNKM